MKTKAEIRAEVGDRRYTMSLWPWYYEQQRKRDIDMRIAQAESEIRWTENKIAELSTQLPRRPSVARQIKDLRRQIRERELWIAFRGEHHEIESR